MIPELGPLIGAMVEPKDPAAPAGEIETVRIELVGALFERARAARKILAAGDESGAREALGTQVWLELWESASRRAAETFLGALKSELRSAAEYSRYPKRRLPALLPRAEDARIIEAKFSSAGIGLEAAAELLSNPGANWQEALRRVAGELEESWRQLRQIAEAEHARWHPRVGIVRSWRRPWRSLVLSGLAALAVVLWVGLVIGGYLPVPGWFRPVADWAWTLTWP